MALNITTPPGMSAFVNLFDPKGFNGGAPRFSLTVIFNPAQQAMPEYAMMKAAVKAAITARLGAAKAEDRAFLRTLRLPFRKAEEKQQQGFDEGCTFISFGANADKRPSVLDLNGRKIVDPSEVWSGQTVRVAASAFYYDRSGNKGVSFGLEHVQILEADKPRLDGRISAEKAFASPPQGFTSTAIGAPVDDDDDVI